MKAVIIEEFGNLDQIKVGTIASPKVEANEVQIKVAYASINPVDWKICAGFLRERMPYEFPITLGWDVAGTITKVGKDVWNFKVGDAVFGYARKSKIKDGTLAEYISLESKNIALKPATLNFAKAAAIPLTGLTAWQCLFETAQLKPGETVLIHAGAGGVGSMAIQFAKHHSATVITTVSAHNQDYVKKLGADSIIDYQKENFVTQIKEIYPEGVDVVFDTVGGSTLEASYNVLKKGGRLVSILLQVPPEIADKHNFQASYVFVHPDGKQLKSIADLIDAGKVKAPEIKEYPFMKTRDALEELKEGHTKGKIVIKINPMSN